MIKNEQFEVLRKINKNPRSSQRSLAKDLGFSVGKINYCLNALKNKGLVKIKNFQLKKNKVSHIGYVLTPRGIKLRLKITIEYMKKKMAEYEELKKETRK